MTLTGLICRIFGAIFIISIVVILFEIMEIRSSMHEILKEFNWYCKLNRVTQYLICWLGIILTVILLIAFVVLGALLLQWGDTIILW